MVQVTRLHDGAFWDVTFGDGKGNILDSAVVEALTELFREARDATTLRAICLRGQGRHFSYGASVEEHLPDQVGAMLPRFHGLFRTMLDSDVVCLAAVRGRCLGGGLELASFCHRVFASPDAELGQPEIVLGVFAPVASILLSERIGRPGAEDLCLTGRTMTVEEALATGLVDVVDDSPEEAARVYAETHLLRLSPSSLRFAVAASRRYLRTRLEMELPELERLYLEELMTTADAKEGIRAFLDKRQPEWRHE